MFFELFVIRAVNREVQLFGVGDDWQAINGFAGSDLRYFRDSPATFTRLRRVR